MQRGYFINIYGPFRVFDETGLELPLPGQKERALIVLLCLTPGYSRSRNWLKAHLWSDKPEHQASASLRQSIWKIKRAFTNREVLIQSDADAVWLKPSIIIGINEHERAQLELFEGADVKDEAFEEWLSIARQVEPETIAESYGSRLPCVIVSNPVISGQTNEFEVAQGSIADDVVYLLYSGGMVDVFDSRNLNDDQSHQLKSPAHCRDAVILWSFHHQYSRVAICVRVVEFGTNRVLGMLNTTHEAVDLVFGNNARLEIVATIVETIEAAAFDTSSQYGQADTIFKAVHQLMSHSLEGQTTARSFLEQIRKERNHAIATAWCAFSYAVGIGERYERGDADFFQKAQSLCNSAAEVGQTNALVHAIIGHVKGFVFRDFEESSAHHRRARELAPGMPLVWDFSSMNALYTGESETAYRYACAAVRLGRFSSLRPYYDTSVMMCAAATGRHMEAIEIGRRVLSKIPKILPVMRHLTGSYAAIGRNEEAVRMLDDISQYDAEFSLDALRDPTYPIIAQDSIELLTRAFEQVGRK